MILLVRAPSQGSRLGATNEGTCTPHSACDHHLRAELKFNESDIGIPAMFIALILASDDRKKSG